MIIDKGKKIRPGIYECVKSLVFFFHISAISFFLVCVNFSGQGQTVHSKVELVIAMSMSRKFFIESYSGTDQYRKEGKKWKENTKIHRDNKYKT